jgi:hypothetical protein
MNECEVAGHEGRRNTTYVSELVVDMACFEAESEGEKERRRKEKECLVFRSPVWLWCGLAYVVCSVSLCVVVMSNACPTAQCRATVLE